MMLPEDSAPEVWPPLLTPFTEDGAIDYPALSRLIEFYVDANVTGLLVLGLSAEPLELEDHEQLELVSYVAQKIAGRIRFTVAALGSHPKHLSERAQIFRDLGADATVFLASQLVPLDAGDESLAVKITQLIDAVPGPLGIYEAPLPYKRVIGDLSYKTVIESSRFTFLKDTSQDDAIQRVRGTSSGGMHLLNAEIYSLRESMSLGYSGFCGIVANVYPDLVAKAADLSDEGGQKVSQLLTIADATLEKSYPSSAKYVLSERRGLDFSSFSRRIGKAVVPRDITSLLAFDDYIINQVQ